MSSWRFLPVDACPGERRRFGKEEGREVRAIGEGMERESFQRVPVAVGGMQRDSLQRVPVSIEKWVEAVRSTATGEEELIDIFQCDVK
ncbi:hypothetical protein JCGZ_01347 [Jatropha curcas]|uniref:Uncharacterized protein n=1 Tax=Jatropha curcas TaxID=180498 RepID=A0A067L8X1_JATCU|nr:hypothetical protein JCGZ_01347 [Jatropha curcas]